MIDRIYELVPFGDYYYEIYPTKNGLCIRKKATEQYGPILLDVPCGIVPIEKLKNKNALR
jgi:hypothetical protein